AIEHFEKALELDPRADRIHYSLAQAWRAQGDGERSAEHLARRGRQGPRVHDPLLDRLESENSFVHQHRGRVALRAGNFERADQELTKALARAPDDYRLRLELAAARSRRGDAAGALSLYREAFELAPEDARVLYNLGTTLLERDEVAEALHHLERAVELDPRHRPARFNLAWALRRVDRPAEALEHLEELVRLDPSHLRARLHRAELRAELDGADAACADIRESLRLFPEDPRLLALAGRLGEDCAV
ncbi:MAG: tetratricopeptide repeat protein, partial [Holophagales bacterium]|nr:tetratricopeptide repeat protein [Holophagales bacterium]